ncbi:MAG: hypothetical protein AAGA09_06920 [Pseudomonadota bacterium]
MIKLILANTLLPMILALVLIGIATDTTTTLRIALAMAAILLAVNIFLFKSDPERRLIIAGIAVLSILALIFFGEISFFTAIPGWLNYLPGGPFF